MVPIGDLHPFARWSKISRGLIHKMLEKAAKDNVPKSYIYVLNVNV